MSKKDKQNKIIRGIIKIFGLVILIMILIMVALTIMMYVSVSNDYYEEEETEELPPYKLTLEENLKTRGALNIYFYNNEYIDKVDENLGYKADCLFIYNERHSLYGVIVSKKEPSPYTTTFPPGNYTFYSKYLDVEGQFTITEPGEFLDLEVDYKTRTYKISYDS